MKGKFREPLKILSALLEEKSALSLIWLQVELKSGNPHIRALTQGCFRRHVTAPAPPAHLKTAFRRDGLWQQHTHTYHRLGSLSSTARRPAKTRHPLPKHGSAPGGFPAVAAAGGHRGQVVSSPQAALQSEACSHCSDALLSMDGTVPSLGKHAASPDSLPGFGVEPLHWVSLTPCLSSARSSWAAASQAATYLKRDALYV